MAPIPLKATRMGAKIGVVGERHQGRPMSPREPGPSGAPTDDEARASYLVSVVRKVDLVENLGGFVLDGFHLHQVRGVLPGPISENQVEGRGQVRRQPWEAENRGNFGVRQTPVLIPVHHFLPGDSHKLKPFVPHL